MYDNIILEKGLYNISGKSFTEALSEIDADENYVGTELEGLDAFERQLKRFDIRVSGVNSDRVEKFFRTTQSAILFPEFVRRCIKAGMDQASVLPHVVAAKTYTNGVDYRGITITKSGYDASVVEGNELPTTSIKVSTTSTNISKYGRQIQALYEVIRNQRLDLFSVILKSVGAQVSITINSAVVSALYTNSDSVETAASGTVTYADLASFWASIDTHNMTAMLVSPAFMAKVLALEEMKGCCGDLGNGVVTTPYGVKLVKCPGMSDKYAIGVDSGSALEAVFGSDIIVDSDKLISSQIDCIAFSVSVGFAKIYPDAIKVLKVKS